MPRYLSLLIVLPALFGCSDRGVPNDGYPDPNFVYRAESHLQTAADQSFLQERPTLYRTTDLLPDLEVRALAVVGGKLWAATAGGLYRFDGGSGKFVNEPLGVGPQPPLLDIAPHALDDGRLALALQTAVVLHTPGGAAETVNIPAAVTSVAARGTQVLAGSESGLFRISGGSAELVAEVGTLAVRDVALDSQGAVWLATASGVVKYEGAAVQSFRAASGALPDDDVRAVFGLDRGVLAGTAKGAALVGTSRDRLFRAEPGGLPYDDVTSVYAAGDFLAFGHGIGATVVRGDFEQVDHYHSLRWLPLERVSAVLIEDDGTRWLATSGGVSRISLEPTTLKQKAGLFEAMNERFWRLDFVSCEGMLSDPWQPDASLKLWDHDNDGLWTQMQVAAWSYAAAASGDKSYCEKARRAMRGMMRLIDIPAVSFQAAGRERGFVARSFVRDDEGDVFSSKAGSDRWVLVKNFSGEGHDYYWKNDTSSDETTGHFFGYPLYYDFCADQAEKAILADHLGALARTIMEHDFYLIDLDGEETTWGHWGLNTLPIALDGMDECLKNYPIDKCYSAAYGGGWLNAIEILGHMLAAYHVTGEKAFYDAYLFLLRNRYDELVDFSENVWTVTQPAVANHSDHELAMLAYHTLIRYEPDEQRRQRWIKSLVDMYQWELKERNPLWAAIVAAFTSDAYRLDDALRTLREWPEDWREWLVDNSHRKDAELNPQNDRFKKPQFTTVLPYDEIRTMKWNGNPYSVSDGGDGRTVQAPWPWLLPYWMLRYYGVLDD
jgi:hypothetical protein